MPIRFHCKRCRQLLGIASRKAGCEIDCPRCGLSQVVPSEEAAAAALAMDQSAKSAMALAATEAPVVYEDEPAVIETPRRPAPSPLLPAWTNGDQGPAARPIPEGMILFPRRTLFVQGMLFLVFGAVALTSGYFIGRGDATYQQQVAQEEAAKQRVPIRGRIVYRAANQETLADENAVIILLPEGNDPQQKLPFRDIRPSDPITANPPRAARLIRELGGEYARADAGGEFFAVLPDQGVYRVLAISNHADRGRGIDIDEVDAAEIGEYFDMPEYLIGRRQYRWTKEQINVGFNPIEIQFADSSP